MKLTMRIALTASVLLIAMSAGEMEFAQKQGGILRMYSPDSPASMSILEKATVFAEGPMVRVFNNLVMFDQRVKQNSLQSIVPDLATGWSWNEDRHRPVQIPRIQAKRMRNPDYWKPDRPYLDAIEYTIMKNLSTATLAFAAGKFDMTFPFSLTSRPMRLAASNWSGQSSAGWPKRARGRSSPILAVEIVGNPMSKG